MITDNRGRRSQIHDHSIRLSIIRKQALEDLGGVGGHDTDGRLCGVNTLGVNVKMMTDCVAVVNNNCH